MEEHKGHGELIEKTEKEIRKIDKILEKLKRTELEEFTNYLSSPWRILWANFLAGTARGLGFIIGVAIVIAAVSFILTRVLINLPLVGQFFQTFYAWMQHTLESAAQIKPTP